MILRVYPVDEQVDGWVEAPPSKSYTHRALFASLLACGDSLILNPLYSGDTRASLAAVERLGAGVNASRDYLKIKGVCGNPASPAWIDCAGSGTTLRIATAVSSIVGEPVLLYGDSTLRRRPMKPLLDALRSLGVDTMSRNGYPPVAVKGPPSGGVVEIDARISSQYVTALLIIAPLIGLRVETVGPVASKPYIDLTLRVFEEFGVEYARQGYEWFEPVSDGYESAVYKVPGDYSSASFMLAIGALTGRVRVVGVEADDLQADKKIVEILEDMGARVRIGSDYIEVETTGVLNGVSIDLRDSPDLAPVVSALAANARGVTVIEGVGHLVFKESNRIKSITSALRMIGVNARGDGGRIVIEGGRVKGGRADSFNDHRIAMMLAVAAVKADGPVEIMGAERIKDSYPSFVDHLSMLGIGVEVVVD